MNINYQINELGSFYVSIVQVNNVRTYNVFPQERAVAYVQASVQEALSDLAPWIASFVRSNHRTNPMFLFLIVVYSFLKTVHLICNQ